MWDHLRDHLWQPMWNCVWKPMRDCLRGQVRDSLWGQVQHRLRYTMRNTVRGTVSSSYWAGMPHGTGSKVRHFLWAKMRDHLWDHLWTAMPYRIRSSKPLTMSKHYSTIGVAGQPWTRVSWEAKPWLNRLVRSFFGQLWCFLNNRMHFCSLIAAMWDQVWHHLRSKMWNCLWNLLRRGKFQTPEFHT